MTAPIIPISRISVFFDGQFSTPRIHHPEGVAIGPDGAVWCGNADGQILRIAPDGGGIELIAETGGFVLGLAFDDDGHLFACEQRHAAVLRLTLATGRLERLDTVAMRIPNYPVVDPVRRVLYVSDSHGFGEAGPGVWRFDLASGAQDLWWAQPMQFANGMALTPDGSALAVCETFARKVSRIAIASDGAAAERTDLVTDLPGLPDGIAFDAAGALFVACYEPSRILRVDPAGRVDLYAEDPHAGLLCHPTNIAFRGDSLFTANLGRWQIARIDSDTSAPPLVATLARHRKADPS